MTRLLVFVILCFNLTSAASAGSRPILARVSASPINADEVEPTETVKYAQQGSLTRG